MFENVICEMPESRWYVRTAALFLKNQKKFKKVLDFLELMIYNYQRA
jgi:hypothetical protein